MTQVVCQHSKIKFEASSTRTKQHPLVAKFKNENVKDYYREAIASLDEAAAMRYQTIEEYMALVAKIMAGKVASRNAAINRQNQDRRDAQQKTVERAKRNEHLKRHGYRWHKEDEESMDAFGATAFSTTYGEHVSSVWTLIAPDGREVTVAQALAEIEAAK